MPPGDSEGENASREVVALGRLLRSRREARGWLPADVAQAAGVSRVTILNLERGSHSSTLDVYLAVSHALGARFAELLDQVEPDAED